ncbi:MAG: sulfatase-like hydrolase/transferase [Alphaproteobacteria bacterium]|nr:sulfatase-like hydrolase/transferase [Alphaproteobacteria bacterium]
MIPLLLLLACAGEPPPPPDPAPGRNDDVFGTAAPEVGSAADQAAVPIVYPQRTPQPVPPGKMKHAVVVVIDTLRDDALARAQTPNIDGLVATGGQRRTAWAASTWTAPSVASMFTGQPVRQHGWDFPFPARMDHAHQTYPPLPDTPLLAEVMRDAGFVTTGLYANQLLGRNLGYGRGFDTWDAGTDPGISLRVEKAVQAWQDDQRHFLYVHLMGPHHPLAPRRISQERWGIERKELGRKGQLALPSLREGKIEESVYWRAYHGVVEDTDFRLSRLMSALRPHMDDTLIIVTSDHGEMLGEANRFGHDGGLWEQLTAVPLVVRNGPTVPEQVGLAALPDIVTKATGVDAEWAVTIKTPPPLVSQREGAVALTLDRRTKAAWDLPDAASPLAWDLKADPYEEQPLAEVPADLLAAHAAWQQAVPERKLQAADAAMDDDTRKALEALGYMGE